MNEEAPDTENAAQKNRSLVVALAIAIGVAITMTCLSVGVYYAAGFYKLDLSRPGYEAEREDITSESTQKTYDTASPVTSQAIDDFLTDYDRNINALNTYGDFRDTAALSDESLSLQPNQ